MSDNTEPGPVSSPAASPTAPTVPPVPRDAIIFIPSINKAASDQSVETIARRIASALDTGAGTSEAQFLITMQSKAQAYAPQYSTDVCSIVRQDGQRETPVADVYELNYQKTLAEHYDNRSLLGKIALLLLALFSALLSVFRVFRRPHGRKMEAWQIFYGLLAVLVLFVYLGLLVWAGVQTVLTLPEIKSAMVSEKPKEPAAVPGMDQAAAQTRAQASAEEQKPKITWQQVLVILTALGLSLPLLKRFVTDTGARMICAIHYFSYHTKENVIMGQLTALLEHVAEKEVYRDMPIHLISYSFGGVIAYDSLFPRSLEPGVRFRRVHSLVTIGFPYDFVETFWPGYFGDRGRLAKTPQRWLNVHAPVDVGSTENPFAVVQAEGTETETIAFTVGIPQKLTFINSLALIGFRSHGKYWEKSYENEIDCFSALVPALYRGSRFLA